MKATVTKEPIVIDASIALAWCFEDEKSAYTEKLLDSMGGGLRVWVPAIWPFEIANTLSISERNGRATVSQSTAFLNRLSQLDILIDSLSHMRVFHAVLSQARQAGATVYDAAYLELALRKGFPLATLDKSMRRAADRLGIPPA